jgi:NhaP-type Na+/H+ or K+/H+ antiporter
VLSTSAQLAAVVAVAAGCDALRDDTGLIAAIFMGLALANLHGFDMPARRPFFETLVQLIIGVLFISISATVTPQSLRHLVLPTLVLVAVLVVVARPVAAFAASLRTDLDKGERAFIGWRESAARPRSCPSLPPGTSSRRGSARTRSAPLVSTFSSPSPG